MRAVDLVADPERKAAGVELKDYVYDQIASVLLEEATSEEAVGSDAP